MSQTDILRTIAASTRKRIEQQKTDISCEEMKAQAMAAAAEPTSKKNAFAFEKAVREGDISFICEVKKASPSKGLIAPHFPYVQIAQEYEAAGASCISCLTEPEFFLGSDQYFREIRAAVSVPMIRKDFTIDEYQIYQAKTMGADCVLLICSLLEEEQLSAYRQICDLLGMSALVEAHDDQEIAMAVRTGARMIGVNNRDLKTFQVDVHNSERLRALVPPECLFVAESGIKTAEDIQVLRDAGVNAVLIGETLMRSPDKKKMLDELKGIKNSCKDI